MKVYLVTSGSHDLYMIRAIFFSEELAQEHLLKLKKQRVSEVDIEEWETDDEPVERPSSD